MDIYTLIHHDHEAAKKLIEQINILPETRYSDRFVLFQQLKEAVVTHNVAESGSFYATLERYKDVRGKMVHSREEHAEVNSMLEKLSDAEMAATAWNTLFSQFQEAFLHHIEEEEGEVFAMARRVLSRQQSIQLVHTMEELKSQKQELLHKASQSVLMEIPRLS